MRIDITLVAFVIGVPYQAEEVVARVDPARRRGEKFQDIELDWGEVGVVALDRDDVTIEIYLDVSAHQHSAMRLDGFSLASPQQRLNPQLELERAEGFSQVIISSQRESCHFIFNLIPLGEHNDWRP